MECQVNVGSDGGKRTEGDYHGRTWHGWTDGVQTWKPFRIPYNAATTPEFTDSDMRWSLDLHAEGIGMTGWDWAKRISRWVAFDFDAITGHSDKHKKKLTDEQLDAIKESLSKIPWVTLRKSTGGSGLHVYVFLTPVLTQNHNEHAALARAVLGQLSALTGTDFESQVDTCGGNMWVWHRKMVGTDGLKIIKQGSILTDIPPYWKDHIKVISGHRRKNLPRFLSDSQTNGSDAERWFEDLTSQYPRLPLDDDHKRLIKWLEEHKTQSWWDADHHMLISHTYHLKEAHAELHMRGIFETVAEGTEAGHDHNCYLFPLIKGGWSVRRYSMGAAEKPSWDQDGRGWTRAFFNVDPDLNSVSRAKGGTEHPSGGFVFDQAELAVDAARLLGASINDLPVGLRTQRATIKSHKDGRLLVEVEGDKNGIAGESMRGWLHDKGKWKGLFRVQAIASPEADMLNYDDTIRHLVTDSGEDAGWTLKRGEHWDDEPLVHVTKALEALGASGKEVKNTLGGSVLRAWRLVNQPFQPEYPGDRKWNRGAAQFKVIPSQEENLCYPTWTAILRHIGSGLDDAIRHNPWALANQVQTGADYLKIWISSLFKEPTEPLPYLFIYSKTQNNGKSTLHEALSLLMTKGYKRADIALTSQGNFNAELASAILCVVEELNLRQDKNAANRIKDLVTAREIAIHAKGFTPYQVINTTHWIQTANDANFCPVLPGDTRITMILVPDLLPEEKIPKKMFMQRLMAEAPHFLAEILKLEIPPSNDRLNVPVIVTAEKAEAQRMNMSPVETFLMEKVHPVSGKVIKYGELYELFKQWADPSDVVYFTKQKFGRELPPHYPKGRLPSDGSFYVGNVSLESYNKGDPVLPKLYASAPDGAGQVFLLPERKDGSKH